MKKVLLTLLIGLVIAAGASYFGMQWKARKSVDDFFTSLSFMDASYDTVNVDLEGQLIIDDINIFIPVSQTTINIGSVKIGTGSLLNSIKFEKDLKAGKLPEQLELVVNAFSMDIDPSLISVMDQAYKGDILSQIFALGCGRYASIGPQQYYDMGFRNLTFDLKLGYQFQPVSDVLVSSIDLYLDGMGNLAMDQTLMGMSGVMENYQSAMFGLDPSSISTSQVHVKYVDLGYNARQADFCAQAAGMEKKEWQQLNVSMVAAMLENIGFESNFDALNLYSKLSSERARLDLKLRPMKGFSAADIHLFDMSDLVQMLDLQLTVNDEPVEIKSIQWDRDRWKNLNLSNIRKEYRVGPQSVPEEEVAEEEPVKQLERILREVPVRNLEQFVHRTVQITRHDGKVFSGEMTQVSPQRIVVRTRFQSGYTDLPLVRDEIAVAKIYPED